MRALTPLKTLVFTIVWVVLRLVRMQALQLLIKTVLTFYIPSDKAKLFIKSNKFKDGYKTCIRLLICNKCFLS